MKREGTSKRMDGYSKYSTIKQVSIPKSRSVEFSHLPAPPQTPRPTANHSHRTQESKQIRDTENTANLDMFPEKEREEVGEIFGVILGRSCSVSSYRLKVEKQNSVLENAVKRAFSMRRSASVSSEGYCRIHHQSDFIVDDAKPSATHTRKTKKKRGKILQACRLLFGF